MRSNMSKQATYNLRIDWMKLIGLIAIIWAVLSLLGWAEESAAPDQTASSQPAITAEKAAESDSKAVASTHLQPDMTQDFLMDNSPLSKPEQTAATSKKATQTAEPEVLMVNSDKTGHECTSQGDGSNGSKNCLIRDEDGSFSEKTTSWENFGDERKEQTVSKHYNSNGDSAGEDTVRIKTNFHTGLNGQTQKQSEYYDIVNQPPQGLITRDMIVKEYNSKGDLKKITWAHYIEMGTRKAGLAHHAVLYYKDGKLTEGYANQYKNGKVIDTLLNYNPAKNPNLRMELTGITKWVGWIDHLIHDSAATKI